MNRIKYDARGLTGKTFDVKKALEVILEDSFDMIELAEYPDASPITIQVNINEDGVTGSFIVSVETDSEYDSNWEENNETYKEELLGDLRELCEAIVNISNKVQLDYVFKIGDIEPIFEYEVYETEYLDFVFATTGQECIFSYENVSIYEPGGLGYLRSRHSFLCRTKSMSIETLRSFAEELGIDTESKTRKEICSEIDRELN